METLDTASCLELQCFKEDSAVQQGRVRGGWDPVLLERPLPLRNLTEKYERMTHKQTNK